MRQQLRITFVCIAIALTACSGQADKHSAYIGFWDLEIGANDYRKVLAIKAQGGGQLVLDYNVLKDANPEGGEKNLVPISDVEGTLQVSSDYVNGSLAISEDLQTLTLAGREYKKISEGDLSEARDSWKQCEALREAYLSEISKVSLSYDQQAVMNKIKKFYNNDMAKLRGCPVL